MALQSVDIRFTAINGDVITVNWGPAGGLRPHWTTFSLAAAKELINHDRIPFEGILLLIIDRLVTNNVNLNDNAAIAASVASAPFLV